VKRTHLPLNGLRVYDAAARHLSFTRAADELAVTPAAVGQHIRALEDMLGVVLFRRTPKGLELTHEGEAGLAALREGFLQFEEAVRAMQAGQSSNRLTIAAPRDFAAKWLSRDLASYAAANPDLRFHIVVQSGSVNFTEANLDLAIVYADGPGEHEGVALAPGTLVTVGQGDARIAWADGPAEDDPLLRVGDAGLAIDAASSGLGRARVPALLADGRDPEPTHFTYWLIAPLPQWRQKKVRALVTALTEAARES
jgi:LysR family glycine cleavage system transcriptional activator